MQQAADGHVRTPLEPVVLAAAFAIVPVLIIESDASSDGWQTAAAVANWTIWAVFAVELMLVLIVADDRRRALRAHWLDLAIVLITVPALAWLRFARFVRLLRIGLLLGRALQAERRLTSGDALRITGLLTLVVIVAAGAGQHTFVAGEFDSMWDGVWWAVVTVTTVGYGDLYPTSVGARLVGIAVMFVGIGFLSIFTAAIASRFVRQDTAHETDAVAETLMRIERDIADIRAQLDRPG